MGSSFRMLAIDGGGIRGIVPAMFLAELEARLKSRTKKENLRLSDYFDCITGTSTGAIITALLLHPNHFSAKDITAAYQRLGKRIFQVTPFRRFWTINGLWWNLYPSKPLEAILDDFLADLKLSEMTGYCIIPTFDVIDGVPFIFNTAKARTSESEDFLMKQVVRAATAAPSFFAGAKVRSVTGDNFRSLIDGGIFANNPAALGLANVMLRRQDLKLKDITLLSLGTGTTKYTLDFSVSEHWGGLRWAKRFIDVQMETSSSAIHEQLYTYFRANGNPARYLRLNPKLYPMGIPACLDNTTDKYLEQLKLLALREIRDESENIDRFVDLLLE